MPKRKKSALSAIKASSVEAPKSQSDTVSLILPYLFLGPCSATSAKSSFISKEGITHVISVGKKPVSTVQTVTYLRLSIEDEWAADLTNVGTQAITFIDEARAGKRAPKIFVHCSAGVSRSPAVIAFYLMHKCDMSLRHALGLIVRARPVACPNPGFLLQLKQVELECRGISSLPSDLTSLPSRKEERLAFFKDDNQVPSQLGESEAPSRN